MATIGDNVLELAMLVKDVKRKTQLSETTIMRVVDMTFALAQQNKTSASYPFDIPEEAPDPNLLDNMESEVIDFPMPEAPDETEA
jgi:hypothetical protein